MKDRNVILAEMKEMIELAKTEERSFTESEATKYDGLALEVETLNDQVKAEKRAYELEKSLVNMPTVETAENQEDIEDFRSFLKMEKRDVDYAENVFAPKGYVAEVIKALDEAVFIRQLAKRYTLNKQEGITIPKRSAKMGGATWGDTPVVDTDLAYVGQTIKPEALNTLVKISKKLLKVSALPIENEIKSEMVASMAGTLETAYLVGDGTDGSPTGIFNTTAVPVGQDVQVGSGITAEAFITAKNKMVYANPVWVIHPDVLSALESVKSGDNFIFMPSFREGVKDTILGIPVMKSKFAPSATTTGSYVAALVDFSEAYAVVDVEQMETQVLNELYAATNQVGFKGYFITGGAPVNADAVLRIKVGA